MCRGTKQRKQDFNSKLKAYSPTALDNVITIAENSFDANTRLIKVEESAEQLKKLEYESNNVLYSYMAQLHNGIQENGDRRRIGCWCKSPTRVQAIALQKLVSLPQYSSYFTDRQRKVISENAKNPDVIRHEQAMKPLIEQKQRELSKLYMEGFQLRHIQKQISNDLKNTMREDNV